MQELQEQQLHTAIEATRAAKEQLAAALAEWPPRYSQLQQQYEALLHERNELQTSIDQLLHEQKIYEEVKLQADDMLEKLRTQLEVSMLFFNLMKKHSNIVFLFF